VALPASVLESDYLSVARLSAAGFFMDENGVVQARVMLRIPQETALEIALLPDGERRLAAATFERCAADLADSHVSRRLCRSERFAREDALEWVQASGPRFGIWCDVAGRDWRDVRRALLSHHEIDAAEPSCCQKRPTWLVRR
jgi:hypothetical protein